LPNCYRVMFPNACSLDVNVLGLDLNRTSLTLAAGVINLGSSGN
jgi:hypothetical protein